jgi:RHS repeat-associated protein
MIDRRWVIGMAAGGVLITTAEAHAARRFVFDGANRLASVQEGGREIRFEYDGRGQVVQTCRRERPAAPWACTELLRDDRARHSGVVAAIGASTRRFVAGPAAAQDDVGFFLEDHLRSPLARIASAGAVTDRRAFDAFGEARRSFDDGRGFGGEWTTAGVVDLRARQYTPTSGRFLQRDTWTFGANGPQGLHRYSYAANAPLALRDPSGHFADYLPDLVNAGISAGQCAATWNDPCASAWGKVFDCGGAALDIGAGIVPFLPAVAGRAKDVVRYGDDVAAFGDDAIRAGKNNLPRELTLGEHADAFHKRNQGTLKNPSPDFFGHDGSSHVKYPGNELGYGTHDTDIFDRVRDEMLMGKGRQEAIDATVEAWRGRIPEDIVRTHAGEAGSFIEQVARRNGMSPVDAAGDIARNDPSLIIPRTATMGSQPPMYPPRTMDGRPLP